MIARLVFLLVMFFSQSGFAYNNLEAWGFFQSQKNWGENNRYSLGFWSMPSYSFDTDEVYQNIMGFTGYYRINSEFSFGAGYVHDVGNDFSTREKRPIFDLRYSTKNYNSLSVRFRAEVRDFSKRTQKDGIRLRLGIRQEFDKLNYGGFTPFYVNEIFFDMRSPNWGNQQGFNQNRLFIGGRTKVNPSLKVDLAILGIYYQKNSNPFRFIYSPFIAIMHNW